MNEVKSEDQLKEDPIYGMSSEAKESQSVDQKSGDNQNQIDSSLSVESNTFPGFQTDLNSQANYQNLGYFEEAGVVPVANYGDYYNYYNNYYRQLGQQNESTEPQNNSNPRTIDLINKALAKQQTKSSLETRDDDEEEGQIPASPGIFNRSVTPSPPPPDSRNSYNKSKSRSPSKERSVRSHSRSRKRHISRSRSRSASRRRRRTRSRSRSPYFGPIIKDYRRGRRGFVRYPRGFRDRGMRSFRGGGHHSNYNRYDSYRRHEYSRSRSRSFSPKRRDNEMERIENNSDDEKTMDSKHSETLKPSDIKNSEKALTQSFLAMLEERQNRQKMVPIVHNNDTSDADRRHGFVNTFNTLNKQQSDRKHTLSYDLEREGWQVIDDASAESKHRNKSTEDEDYDEKHHYSESMDSTAAEKMAQKDADIGTVSSDHKNKNKKKKSKKQKKSKKRKASTSSDSSESESDAENEEEVDDKPKKRSKKKKKKKSKKRKRRVSSSSSSSEIEEQNKKQKKKKKKRNSSSESESEDISKEKDTLIPELKASETIDFNEKMSSNVSAVKESVKTKDKKKSKHKSSDSSDSDSDVDKKKKKKKKKRGKTKKRKYRSSSSSSSDSSDSSESGDRKKKKKKKSKKKSKKSKRKTEKKDKSKTDGEDKKPIKQEEEEEKDSEFVSVLSIGEPPLELKWPKKLIKLTHSSPPLQYSINPKVIPNYNELKGNQRIEVSSELEDIHRKEPKESYQLATEYERFIDELNPNEENYANREETNCLETKLRDKLVKQFNDRNETQKQDFMTSSDRRAFERSKKQNYFSTDGNDKRQEELKSAPLSAYYSPKVQKTSPITKNNDSEYIESKSHRNDKISLNSEHRKESASHMSESSHRHDSSHRKDSHRQDSSQRSDSKNSEIPKTEDKKRTARELLERVKQKKHSDKDSKESTNKDKNDSKSDKKLPQIGKMKIPPKKSLLRSKSVTTANADSTQNAFVSQPMALDMNYDYNWYYNYYMNSVYGVGQYPQVTDPALASAYYAHYSMLTSYDYNQIDLNNWISQKGYTLDASDVNQIQTDIKSSEQTNETNIKSEELEPSVESSAPEEINDSKESIVKKEVKSEETTDVKIETTIQQNIEVLVSATHSDIPFEEPKRESLTDSENQVSDGMTSDLHNTVELNNIDEKCVAPPPPPPPRPMMTRLTSTEAITLPNGEVLPAGTKQVVVHPYQTGDPYKFTADWFCDAFNAQNKTQTKS